MGKSNIFTRIFAQPIAGYLSVFLISAIFYAFLQWGNGFADPDSFYHMRMTLLTIKDGPVKEFAWLPLTVLAQNFADHHFLYHLTLIPFFLVAGPFLGIKIATVFLASLATTIFYGLLRAFDFKRHAFWFTLLLITCGGFFFRMNLAKTPSIAIIWFLLELLAIIKNRHWMLLLLSFSHVWLHGSWILLPIIFFLYMFSIWMIKMADPPNKRPHLWLIAKTVIKNHKRGLAAIFGGIIGGLIINPFFPNNLRFYWEQIFQIALVNYRSKLNVGVEWHGHSLGSLIRQVPLLFAALLGTLAGIIYFHNDKKPIKATTKQITLIMFFCLLAFVFFLMSIRQRRQVEYLAPVLTLFIASLAGVFLAKKSWNDIWKKFKGYGRRLIPIFFSGIIIISCLSIITADAFQMRKYGEKMPKDYFKTAAIWMKNNIPEDELIVNLRWDDFPILFFRNDNYRWFGGLDPTFGYRADPELWQKLNDVRIQSAKADPINLLKLVKSRYYFLRREGDVLKFLSQNSELERVYLDDEAVIFRLKQR